MNLIDLINSKKLQLILVILAILLVSIPIYIGLMDSSSNITDNEYDMSYAGDGIVISQENSDVSEELNMNIKYNDGFERNKSIILSGDNSYISVSEREDNYIDNVELYTNKSGERIILSQLESQNINIEEFTVSNFSLSTNEPYVLSATDYISDTKTIESYTWEFEDGVILNGESISRDFSMEEYNVVLTVENEFGKTQSDSFTINIEEQSNLLQSKPSIQLESGEKLELSGENTVSYNDEDIVSYSWDFDDGTIKEGKHVSHSYTEGGLYNITLTSEDSSGNVHTDNIQINVLSDIESDIEIADKEGFKYTFDASDSVIEDDMDDLTYHWDFGDGNTDNTTNPVINHTYEDANTYTVSLTIRSENNSTSTSEIDVTTLVSLEFNDSMPYSVVSINNNYEDVILPNHELGDEWPEIIFIENSRYEFVNLPSDIEFIDENDNILLSQRESAKYENDDEVDWVDENNTVRFTVTEELGNELFGYQTFE